MRTFSPPVVDHRLATHMRSDALTRTIHLEVESTFRLFALVSLVRMEHAVGTSEETMGWRLVPNGRPQ